VNRDFPIEDEDDYEDEHEILNREPFDKLRASPLRASPELTEH
jgi:hypothetical protein